METTTHEHLSPLRKQDITSTDCAALFGHSKYCTQFELWHRKKGNLSQDIKDNERMEFGRALEPVIGALATKKLGAVSYNPFTDYVRIPELRIGSSFDFIVNMPDASVALLECKNVDAWIFNSEWSVEDNIIPYHIELQVQHQMLVSGIGVCYVAVLVGGNRIEIFKREAIEKVQRRIKEVVGDFWRSIDMGKEPEPFDEQVEPMNRLYAIADPGSRKNMSGNEKLRGLAKQHAELARVKRDAEKELKKLRAAILPIIKDFEFIEGGDFEIKAPSSAPVEVAAHVRAGSRKLFIKLKETKENVSST